MKQEYLDGVIFSLERFITHLEDMKTKCPIYDKYTRHEIDLHLKLHRKQLKYLKKGGKVPWRLLD